MKSPAWACLAAAWLAAAPSEAAIAPVEDPDACLSTEQRTELAQRGRELFFRGGGGGSERVALAQARLREASDARERASAELRLCEATPVATEAGAGTHCAAQRAAVAELEQRVAVARAEQTKRNVELADELTARARKMREEFPACAVPRG